MKKRKVKPSSNVAKVLDLMKADPKISVKELIAQTGFNATKVYAIRNYIKKNRLFRPLPMTGIAPKAETKLRMLTASDFKADKEVTNLLKENKTLTEWTVMWKRKCEALEKDLNQAKVMYLDQLAVVRYLEAKLLQLVESKIKEQEQV